MRVKTYMRVAQQPLASTARGRRPKVDAAMFWNNEPLRNSRGDALPTIAFAVEFDLPDEMFERATQTIAEILVSEEQATIATEVVQK